MTKRSLQIILGISIFGLLFSGYLSYQELFAAAGTATGGYACPPVGAPGTVFGYPACVYGFFMYLLIVIVAVWGLWAKR